MKYSILVIAVLVGVLAYVGLPLIADSDESKTDKPTPKPTTVEQDKNIVRFDNGVTVYLEKDERVEAEAEMLGGQSRLLEFLAVTSSGPVHEALLRIYGKAYDIHQGLELLGLKCGTKKLEFRGDPADPDGPKVDVSVKFKDKDGKKQETPIHEWLYNVETKKPMEAGPWIFTGSISEFREELNRDIYLADQMSTVIALWHDPSCLLDNPREGGARADVYAPNQQAGAMPAPRSVVQLVFRPHKEKK